MRYLDFDEPTLSRILSVIDASTNDFADLALLAGLKPSRDFIRSDLKNLDFGESDLSKFTFTGADVRGADFSRSTGLRISALVDIKKDETTRWPKHLVQALSRQNNEGSDFAVLETRSYDEIYRIESEKVRKSALQALDEYFFAKELIGRASSDERARAGRLLFALSASIDKHAVEPLTRLVNRLFLREIWERFVRYNISLLPNIGRPKTPMQFIAQLEAQSVHSRIASLGSIFSQFVITSHPTANALRTGLLLCASIEERTAEGSLFFSWCGRKIEIVPELQSIGMFHGDVFADPPKLFSIRANGMGSARGAEFITSCLSMIFPTKSDDDWQLFLGASNSWLVIMASAEHRAKLLANRGVYLAQIRDLLGLRRITVVLKCEDEGEAIKEFCNASWRGLTSSFGNGTTTLNCVDPIVDQRKLRSFTSMFTKVFPTMNLIFNYRIGSEDEVFTYKRPLQALTEAYV
ncbi:pentapeptide repeat-containing protein [Agrobacterium sp. 16-172Ci]